jgi:hypothetical protein
MASAGSRAMARTRVAGPFDQIAEVPRDEHLVFDDQDVGRHDTADWSGKVTCTP